MCLCVRVHVLYSLLLFSCFSAEDVHEELSSGLQNLNLCREGQSATSTVENPAVIIPRHLQVTNADCSHLSFGSFGLGIGASLPGVLSKPGTSNLEVTSENTPPTDYPDARYLLIIFGGCHYLVEYV